MRVTASRLRRARARPTSSSGSPDRGRSARRCAVPPAPRPRPARRTPFRPRDRETAAPAPRAPRRAWRPPSAPTCRGRADARCPGRFSPPMPLRSSTWCSSALTSVPLGMAGRRMHDHPRRLVDDDEVAVLVEDGERQRFGLRRWRRPARGRRRRSSWPAFTGWFALAAPPGDLDVAVLDQALNLRSRLRPAGPRRETDRGGRRRCRRGP